jgi:drug/metabolite transporter (DMT)-like permease
MFWIFFGFALLSSAISVNKVILATLPPTFFVGLRMLMSGVILCALSYKSSPRMKLSRLRQDLPLLIWIACCTTLIPSILKAFGLQNLVSSKAAFIGALDPFVTAIYSYLFWRETLSIKKIIGVLLGFSGAVILCFSHSPIEETFYTLLIFSLPELAAFGSVAIGRYGWICAQIAMKKDRYTPPELNGLMMLISGVLALTASRFVDTVGFADIPLTPGFLGLIAYTVIVGNVIAYTMYAQFLKAYSANFVSLAGFSVPIFVTLYGKIFLHETITTNLVIAALLILAGVFVFFQDEMKISHT